MNFVCCYLFCFGCGYVLGCLMFLWCCYICGWREGCVWSGIWYLFWLVCLLVVFCCCWWWFISLVIGCRWILVRLVSCLLCFLRFCNIVICLVCCCCWWLVWLMIFWFILGGLDWLCGCCWLVCLFLCWFCLFMVCEGWIWGVFSFCCMGLLVLF